MKPRHERRLVGNASVPDDLAGLFAAERARPEVVSRDVHDRVWGRVGASVGLVAPGGAEGGGGGGGDLGGASGGGSGGVGATSGASGVDAAPIDASATSTGGMELGSVSVGATEAMVAKSAAGLGASAWLASTGAKAVLGLALTGLAAGGVTLARGRSETAPMPPAPTGVASVRDEALARDVGPSALPTSQPSARAAEPHIEAEPRVALAPSSPVAAAAPSTSGSSIAAPTRDDELGAERDLLEKARASLGSGDAPGALRQLADHAARFPKGRMGDEREALAIRALVVSGRRDEARARFDRFRERSPRSLLVPAMEAALGAREDLAK
jgi:hypothetical protein